MKKTNNSEPLNKPGAHYGWLAILFIVIIVIWGLSWFLSVRYLPDWQARSSFGDMFGAINALFSGAALAGVVFAILLQKQELQLQRNELEMTRSELRRTAEAQEKSEEALAKQAQMMTLSARLNALSIIIEAQKTRTELTSGMWGSTRVNNAEEKRILEYIEKLDRLIQEIEQTHPQHNNGMHPTAHT